MNNYEHCIIVPNLKSLSKKWTIPIICELSRNKILRYNQLRRNLCGITNMVLSQSLKSLENHNIVCRTQYNEIPPRVEYSLTDIGHKILPIFFMFSKNELKQNGNHQCNFDCCNVYDKYNDTIKQLDETYENFYNDIINDEKYQDFHSVDSMKLIFISCLNIINEAGYDYAKYMSIQFLQQDSLKDILTSENRPLYTIYKTLIANGKENSEIITSLTYEQIILAFTAFSRGTIHNWSLAKGSYDLIEANKEIIDWFFSSLKTKP